MSVEVHPQFVVDEQGKRRSVLLSLEEFKALMQEREDYEDALCLYQMSQTAKPEDFEDWEVVKERLRAAGKIE